MKIITLFFVFSFLFLQNIKAQSPGWSPLPAHFQPDAVSGKMNPGLQFNLHPGGNTPGILKELFAAFKIPVAGNKGRLCFRFKPKQVVRIRISF